MKIPLSNTKRQELESAHGVEREAQYSDRLKAILYLDRGMNYEEIGDLLLCDSRTIRRHQERYLVGGLEALLSDDRGGSSGRLSDEQTEELRNELKQHVHSSSKTIRAMIQVK